MARTIIVASIEDGVEVRREEVTIQEVGPLARARFLRGLGAEVLICSAISRPMEMALVSSGIEVRSGSCGDVGDVLAAYRQGRLSNGVFRLPGASHQGESVD